MTAQVALVVITDRGDLYKPKMEASLAAHCDWPFSTTITVDDSEHKLGMAGAVNDAWSKLPEHTNYVFHVEEDWVFLRDVPVEQMCRALTRNPHLAQMVLPRQALTPEEHAAGGVVGPHLGELVEGESWTEHRRIFSLNPCVYPYWVTRRGWPAGNEAEFTEQMAARGLSFAFWGAQGEQPYVEHIGVTRGAGWRL